MSNMHYVSVRRRSREAILAALSGKNADEIGDALLSAAYWEDDWEWAQEQLFKFSEFDSDKVLWAVATGIGFIAAFHGEVDERAAEAIINRLMTRRAEAAAAEETLADIDQFVRRRKGGRDIDLAERLPEDWQPPSGHLNQNPGDEPS